MGQVLGFCPPVAPNLAAGRAPRATKGKAPQRPGEADPEEARAAKPAAKKQKKAAAPAVESIVDESIVDMSIVDDWASDASGPPGRPAAAAHAYGALSADVQAQEIADLKQQLVAKVEENSALGAELARVPLEGAQAEGLAKANERHIQMLTEELAAARERAKQEAATLAERLDEARAAATLRAGQKQDEKLREVHAQFEDAITKTEAARREAVADAKAETEALREQLARAETALAAVEPAPATPPAPAAKKRRKSAAASSNSGPGRRGGLPDVPYQFAPELLAEIEWEGNDFFEKLGAVDDVSLHRKYHTWVTNKVKMYHKEEIKSVVQQCKWHVEYFLRMLSLRTGKYPQNDIARMCAYLDGTEDITRRKEAGQLFNRDQQVAQWLWPDLVKDHASFSSEAAKKVKTKAHKHMTAVRGLYEMYKWFQVEGKAMPAPWTEGVDAVPPRKVKGERQGAQRADGGEEDGEEDGEEAGESTEHAPDDPLAHVEEEGVVDWRLEEPAPTPAPAPAQALNDTAAVFRAAQQGQP
jgi:hypothetical protein